MWRRVRKVLKRFDAAPILACLFAGYIWILSKTGRWVWENEPVLDDLEAQNSPIIIVFWHGRQIPMSLVWRQRKMPIHVLISYHRDGDIPTRIGAFFGHKTIRGSSSRGGTSAMRHMTRILKNNGAVAVTPDGPRGPRMRVKKGVVSLAQLTGAPVVPVTMTASSMKTIQSWDKMLIPLPFSTFLIRFGAPIFVPRVLTSADLEAMRQRIEEDMIQLSQKTDQDMGVQPIEPVESGF